MLQPRDSRANTFLQYFVEHDLASRLQIWQTAFKLAVAALNHLRQKWTDKPRVLSNACRTASSQDTTSESPAPSRQGLMDGD